jgi:hypothetical protein
MWTISMTLPQLSVVSLRCKHFTFWSSPLKLLGQLVQKCAGKMFMRCSMFYVIYFRVSWYWQDLWYQKEVSNWLIDWLIDWLIYWLIGWLIDWLIDWFQYWSVYIFKQSLQAEPDYPRAPQNLGVLKKSLF